MRPLAVVGCVLLSGSIGCATTRADWERAREANQFASDMAASGAATQNASDVMLLNAAAANQPSTP